MRRVWISACVGIASMIVVSANASASGLSITDLYKKVQCSIKSDPSYPLVYSMLKDKWVTISPEWGTLMDVTVDTNNNYIQMIEMGGDGSYEMQLSMIADSDEDGQILIESDSNFVLDYPSYTTLSIYRYTPESGITLLEKGVNRLRVEDFMPEEISSRDRAILNQLETSIYYRLPKQGHEVDAILAIRAELDSPSLKKGKIYKYYQKNLKKKIYKNIKLLWRDNSLKVGPKSRETTYDFKHK